MAEFKKIRAICEHPEEADTIDCMWAAQTCHNATAMIITHLDMMVESCDVEERERLREYILHSLTKALQCSQMVGLTSDPDILMSKLFEGRPVELIPDEDAPTE